MNYRVYIHIDGDSYEIHMRGANIVSILRNNRPIEYDDLSLHVRESILIEALSALAKFV